MAGIVRQGNIIQIEHQYLIVVSKDYFNQTEQIIACPIIASSDSKAYPSPVHHYISSPIEGIVFCEQLRYFDVSRRHYQIAGDVPFADLMEVSDIIQGLIEYQLY